MELCMATFLTDPQYTLQIITDTKRNFTVSLFRDEVTVEDLFVLTYLQTQ